MATTCHLCSRDGDTTLCPTCTRRTTTWLTDLPRLYAQLPAALTPAGGLRDGGSGSKRPEAPMPLRGDALSLLAPGSANGDVRMAFEQAVYTWSEDVNIPGIGWREVYHRELLYDPHDRPILQPIATQLADQVGPAPVAAWLGWWAADWRERYGWDGIQLDDLPGWADAPAHPGLYLQLALSASGRVHGRIPGDPVDAEARARFGTPDLDAAVYLDAQYLARRLPTAVDHPDLPDFLTQLRAQHGALLAVLGERDDLVYLGRCPEPLLDRLAGEERPCGAQLWQDPYVDLIRCPRCRVQTAKAGWLGLAKRIRATWGVPGAVAA